MFNKKLDKLLLLVCFMMGSNPVLAVENYIFHRYQEPANISEYKIDLKQKLNKSKPINGLKFAVAPYSPSESQSSDQNIAKIQLDKHIILAFQNLQKQPLLLHLNWSYRFKGNPTYFTIYGYQNPTRKMRVFEEPILFSQLSANSTSQVVKVPPNEILYFVHSLLPLTKQTKISEPTRIILKSLNSQELNELRFSFSYKNDAKTFCGDDTSDACVYMLEEDLLLPVWVGEITSNQIYFK